MRDLDKTIMDMTARTGNPIGFMEAASFFTGMKKIAEGEMPDTTGAVEGPFLVPLPQAVELIAAMIANEFKTQVHYVYYANMLRGLSHEGIAEEFMEHAKDELDHATYLLRRMSVLSPGGVVIPPYESPEPLADPVEIINKMIVVEQIGLSLWKELHAIMGDNPMKYTIEQFLQTEEEHQDELWQLVEAMKMPETPGAQAAPAEQEPKAPEPAKTQVKVETTAPQTGMAMEPKVARILFEAAARKQAADLTASSRAQIDDKNFVFPKERKYPIHDKDHALAALGMVGMHGTPDEKSKVHAAVHARYPGLTVKKAAVATYEQLQNWARRARVQADEIHKKDQRRVVAEPVFTNSDDDLPLKNNKFQTLSDLVKKSNFGMGGPVEVPPPGMDSPEAYVARERQLGAQQAMAEASHAKTVAMQATQAAQQAQAEAQAAQEQLAQAQQQVEQLGQQAAQESQQSMMATQQAAEAEARAADHSIQKMQLGMRINQVRQELANLVMQDPVAESAATVSDLAAQGQPATPMQQAQAEQQAAAAANGEQPSAETQQQTQEAQNAQAEAAEQTQQAEQSAEGDKAKGGNGTSVTVKTSEMATIVGKPGSARGAVGAAAAPAAGGLGALIAKARPYAPHIAAGAAGLGLLGGGMALAHHARNVAQPKTAGVVDTTSRAAGKAFAEGAGEAVSAAAKKHAPALVGGAAAGVGLAAAHGAHRRQQAKGDLSDAIAEGMRRAKTASPADRRMARAILDGPEDALSHSLINIIRKHAPATAGVAGAEKAMADAGQAVRDVASDPEPLSALGARLRPHMPGFVAGLGGGILGTKMMSGNQQTQPPAYYVQ